MVVVRDSLVQDSSVKDDNFVDDIQQLVDNCQAAAVDRRKAVDIAHMEAVAVHQALESVVLAKLELKRIANGNDYRMIRLKCINEMLT